MKPLRVSVCLCRSTLLKTKLEEMVRRGGAEVGKQGEGVRKREGRLAEYSQLLGLMVYYGTYYYYYYYYYHHYYF